MLFTCSIVAPILEEGLHTNLNYQFINISEIDDYVSFVPSCKNWENSPCIVDHISSSCFLKFDCFDIYYEVSSEINWDVLEPVHHFCECLSSNMAVPVELIENNNLFITWCFFVIH